MIRHASANALECKCTYAVYQMKNSSNEIMKLTTDIFNKHLPSLGLKVCIAPFDCGHPISVRVSNGLKDYYNHNLGRVDWYPAGTVQPSSNITVHTSHSAYVATVTESNGAKIDGF